MRSARDGAGELLLALREEGGTLAETSTEPAYRLGGATPGVADLDRPGPAQIAAAGPRAGERRADYELLIEMIFEGSCLHYGQPRVVRAEDPDLALLLGDQLYALGLTRLAALGDLEAVGELADVISLVAQAHSVQDPELAQAVWEAGAVAVGWGPSERHQRAKQQARAHRREALSALRETAAEALRGRSS